MAYVPYEYFANGTELMVSVRKSQRKAQVTKMPFVEAHYYRA